MRKKVVYFIPGTMCDERLWQEVWQRLDKHVEQVYQFVHLPIPQKESMATIINCLGEQIAKSPGYVVGFSLGGYIAGGLALEFNHVIEKMMIISNSLSHLPTKEIANRLNVINWLSSNHYAGISSQRIREQIHPNNIGNNSLFSLMKAMDDTLGKPVLLHQLSVSTQRERIFEQVCDVSNQLTLVVGDKDPLVPLNELTHALMQFPAHYKIIIGQCGHMLPLEQPQKLAAVMNDWLK